MPPMRAPDRFGPLTEPHFRTLWIGRTASFAGDALVSVAIIFAVLAIGGTVSDVGFVLGITMAARVSLVLVGGVVADRLPRRLVLLGSDLMLAALQVFVAVILFTGTGRVWMLLVASVVYGAGAALFRPALTGIVAETVSVGRLPQATALISRS